MASWLSLSANCQHPKPHHFFLRSRRKMYQITPVSQSTPLVSYIFIFIFMLPADHKVQSLKWQLLLPHPLRITRRKIACYQATSYIESLWCFHLIFPCPSNLQSQPILAKPLTRQPHLDHQRPSQRVRAPARQFPATHDDMLRGKIAALGHAASTTIQNEISFGAQ